MGRHRTPLVYSPNIFFNSTDGKIRTNDLSCRLRAFMRHNSVASDQSIKISAPEKQDRQVWLVVSGEKNHHRCFKSPEDWLQDDFFEKHFVFCCPSSLKPAASLVLRTALKELCCE
ncbi:unnamed protein product [Calypogeia fissa]